MYGPLNGRTLRFKVKGHMTSKLPKSGFLLTAYKAIFIYNVQFDLENEVKGNMTSEPSTRSFPLVPNSFSVSIFLSFGVIHNLHL